MILDDLIACVTLSTNAWLREKDSAGALTIARRSHDALVLIANSTGPSSGFANTGLGWRRPLFEMINEIGDFLVQESIACLDSMHKSGVRFLLSSSTVRRKWKHLYVPLDEFQPVIEFHAAFKLTPLVRKLPTAQQKTFVQTLEMACEREVDRFHFLSAEEDGEVELMAKRSKELEKSANKVTENLSTLGASAKALFPLVESSVSPFGIPYKHIPTRIHARADQASVIWTANLYERVSQELSTHLEADPQTSETVLIATEAAWTALRDYGQSFAVLASWLRASTVSEAARRCQLCYRHVGPKMKRFCNEHKRTKSEEKYLRQPARDFNVATVYKATHREFTKHLPDSQVLFGVNALVNIKADESLVTAARLAVHNDLVPAAALLAALLRHLYPLIAPILQDRVAEHFGALLKAANEPFIGSGPYSSMEKSRVTLAQARAPMWLGFFTFFRTLYGADLSWDASIVFDKHMSLDIDHPLVHGQSVAPGKLAIDLGHLKCWQAADSTFDQRFYLNMAKVSKLRSTVDPKSGRQTTLATIGQVVGASHEAVRELLNYSSGLNPALARRDRILRSKKEFLSKPVDLTAPTFPAPSPLVEPTTSLIPKRRSLFFRGNK